jgi:hypothetical protein
MTREETIKVLAILKAAYPNSYKNMTREEAQGTVSVWAMQFAAFPVEVVLLAINKIIASSTFPPTISEVKEKMRGMYWELWGILKTNEVQDTLSDLQVKRYQSMLAAIEPLRASANNEPAISDIMVAYNQYYIE